MASYVIILVIVGYLSLLFAIGIWADRRSKSKWVHNPWVYALSLAVYCSAWTYYGSVGIAATSGISFLTTYLGPIIALPLWILVLKRIVVISKQYQVASIADFISLRYGNKRSIGALVTIICVIAVFPYIALQLKAVSETFDILSGSSKSVSVFTDSTFYIAVLLAVFVALFGTQTTDASRRRSGLIFTVAVESVLKLVFFLIIGVYVTFYLFDGTTDIYNQISALDGFEKLATFSNIEASINWYFMIALSFFAIFLLPRQFQVSVVENTSVSHLKKASWVFPLYLLLFNVFVIFIAWAGKLLLSGELNPDYYTLYLPLAHGHKFLGLMVFLGGLSSVISMVVVSALALSTMISNNLIIPYGFIKALNDSNPKRNAQRIKNVRRASIFILIIGAYFFYVNFNIELSLFSIGLIAFVIIAQLAPAFFIGLFWNRGSAIAAKTGIIVGSLVTFYTLVLPFITEVFVEGSSLITNGPAGIALLKPYELFGVDFMPPVTHAFFWSMVFNVMSYLVFSVLQKGDYRERNYAELVVNVSSYGELQENAFVWRGEAYVSEIRKALIRFLGEKRTTRALNLFYRKYNIDPQEEKADARLVNFSEKLLTGSIGAASAKLMISSVVKEQPVSLPEVLKILEENKETITINKQLQQQSHDLKRLSDRLKNANQALVEKDRQKDEFLDTVAHELKTPTASIRAASEILFDDDDMPVELKKKFLDNIVNDSDRLAALITNILDLEKLSNGREVMDKKQHSLKDTLHKAVDGVYQLALKKQVKIDVNEIESINLYYDEDRILQVFTNLLSNSIKFVSSKDGVIKVKTQLTDTTVLMIFEDNGKGIPQEDMEFIFDKFYQSNNQNVKKPMGSGMGLAISRHIIESHHGSIRVDPDFIDGARFIVEFKK
ncbi:ATP-binding protein [Nonlabens ulvanivorans]|uniref:ATP-binding protein n=1 Tax=Nonlabens ulvanivorans TaxID=906888 RepID=UPI002942F3AB|nr:ATP-binding protein [Nonlabens ulvanivorans]WOI21858.1 ATP-binding protein [Nonlabens ulvanivorans]